MTTETLTDALTTALLTEAVNAGDGDMAHTCRLALGGELRAQVIVADVISAARDRDESTPFVLVVAADSGPS